MEKINKENSVDFPQQYSDAYDQLSPDLQRLCGLYGLATAASCIRQLLNFGDEK